MNTCEPFSIWTIFERPDDYPSGFIARRFDFGGGLSGPVATTDVIVGRDLDWIRVSLRNRGLYCLGRETADGPRIVESWL